MLTLTLLAVAALVHAPTDTSVRIARGDRVTIDAGMQSVLVRGVDGDRVTTTGGDLDYDKGEVVIDAMTASIKGMIRGRGGNLVISVPRWASVSVTSINGSIRVEDAPEGLEAEAVNGGVTVSGGSGTMTLSSATGEVRVRDFRGQRLEIESIAGAVEVDGATGSLVIESVNEPIVLRRITARSVDASSTNGHIRWIGAIDPGGRYRFESHNGRVVLQVPGSLDARLRITTFLGDFSTSIPATTSGRATGTPGEDAERTFTVTFGRGAASVEIQTFNGSVRVEPIGAT